MDPLPPHDKNGITVVLEPGSLFPVGPQPVISEGGVLLGYIEFASGDVQNRNRSGIKS